MNRLIRMVMNRFLFRTMGKASDHLSRPKNADGTNKSNAQMTAQERKKHRQTRSMTRNATKALRMIRRIGRF